MKYIIGSIITIPLLPFLYFQGKKLRKNIPELPEAINPQGTIIHNEEDKTSLKLLSIGESTIAGIGVKSHEEGITACLSKKLSELISKNIDWNVYAKSGYTAKLVRKRLMPKISEKNADIIIIGLGGNDAFTLNKPSRWKNDLSKLIFELKQIFPRTPIIFLNMPPIKDFPAFPKLIKLTIGNYVEILASVLSDLVKKHDKVYFVKDKITLNEWLNKLDNNYKVDDFFSDGMHPSKLTYRLWGHEIAQYINKNNILNKN